MPSADDRYARITREQYDYAKREFEPVLNEMLRTVDDPGFFRTRVDMAGNAAGRAFDAAEGTQDRTLERYGANVSPAMNTALDRSADLSRGLSEVDARNNARMQLSDQREDLRMGLIGIGRETSREAQGIASGIAGRESARESASRQIDAQESAARTQAVGTIIGMGMMALASSSREVKEVEGPADRRALTEQLEQVMLHRFQYVADVEQPGNFVGLIAEEAPEIFQGPDGRSVNMYNLVSALIAGYQQQSEEIAALKRQVELLESEVDDGR